MWGNGADERRLTAMVSEGSRLIPHQTRNNQTVFSSITTTIINVFTGPTTVITEPHEYDGRYGIYGVSSESDPEGLFASRCNGCCSAESLFAGACCCLGGLIVGGIWTLSTVLAIMSFVYGAMAMYYNLCPIMDHWIPILFIVAGCFQFSFNFTTFRLLGFVALCSWIGSIVVLYLAHPNVNLEDPMDGNYCQPVLYRFGAWASITALINGSVLGCMFSLIRD